jgi:hypothetical protein
VAHLIRSAILVAAATFIGVPWHATEIGRSPQGKWTTPQTLVYQDSAAFRDAWAQLFPVPSLRPALPAIDFSRYRVFIVASGARPTGGFRMALDEGHVVGDSALITVNLFSPPAGCAVTQEITTPAVAIAALNSPAAFRIITRTRPDTLRCN